MQSAITALAACLFVTGVALLFFALFHDGSAKATIAASFVFLGAAIAAWSRTAYLDGKAKSSDQG